MDDIRLASITTEDVAEYRTARLRALQEDPDAFTEVYEDAAAQPPAFWEERVAANAEHADSTTHLAWRDGSIVGMVSGVYLDGGEVPDLVAMWVAPEARRRGLAEKLVYRVGEWARATGAKALELWVVTGNDAAITLYERCGFVVKAEHRASPNDPCRNEVRMRLDLVRSGRPRRG